jgi:hypothetical protein
LLDLIELVEAGTIGQADAELIARFLERVQKLTDLLRELTPVKRGPSSITLKDQSGPQLATA